MSDYDSFEEDDDDYGILKKALHVELPENFNPDKLPQTGEEYLQHVVYERTKHKKCITAVFDRTKFSHKQTFRIESDSSIKTAPDTLLPSLIWQTNKIEEFTNFRRFIQFKIAEMGQESTISSFDEKEFLDQINMQGPNFLQLVLYTQAAKVRMLQIINKSMDFDHVQVNNYLGTWIYAILVLLEKPLNPSFCYSLREFAKKCLNIRANLSENASKQIYTPLNLFVCIIARFYQQLDLADV